MRETRFLTRSLLLAFALFFVTRCNLQPNVAGNQKEEAMAEVLIRQRVEDYAKAIRARTSTASCLSHPRSFHSTSTHRCDMPAPTINAEPGRNSHHLYRPVGYEIRDLNVTTDGNPRLRSQPQPRERHAGWRPYRRPVGAWTACFRRIDGVWLVARSCQSQQTLRMARR